MSLSLHREIRFEDEVCEYLAAHDWHYTAGDASHYDRTLALFSADVLTWVQQAQPKAWEALTKNQGAQAGDVLLARLREQIDKRGTLDVLRHGIELLGLRQKLPLAQFKPALAMNPEILTRYTANRLRIVRQVRYSIHNENCIDLVLFLNGISVATVELKTDFTQSVEDAVDQYRFDRLIKGKLLESHTLVQQATNNTKEQFSNSPDLANGILNAIMDAFAAHTTMSKQALESEKVRSGLKDVLLGPAQLYLPEKADWLAPYMHELTTFPNGKFDDQVDSTSQALDWVRGRDRYCYGLLEYHKQVIAGTIKSPEASSIFLRPRTFRD